MVGPLGYNSCPHASANCNGGIDMNGARWTTAFVLLALGPIGTAEEPDAAQYPSANIANERVRMTVYLPDAENGFYRGARFDWSGVIASAVYRGHEYFGPWREEHDPMRHDSITGPVEGYIAPGLGYEEARPGEAFLRIGIGALERVAEEGYHFRNQYKFLNHGRWTVEQGGDWISFRHEIGTDLGYAYRYYKTLRLKEDGFVIEHRLDNTGRKPINTDQFNHNFLVIDGTLTGAGFSVEFPFAPTTGNDLRDRAVIDGNMIRLTRSHAEQGVRLELQGYSDRIGDHKMTVRNRNTGAGVTIEVDQPLTGLVFWTNRKTLSPENFIQISAAPGESVAWTSSYTFFVDQVD